MATGINVHTARIHGSLKASVQNKSYKNRKQTSRQRGCQSVQMKTSHVRWELIGQSWDEAQPATSVSWGQDVCLGVLSSLCLSLCSGASLLFLSVCSHFFFFFLQFQYFKANIRLKSSVVSLSSQSLRVFYSKSPDKWFRKTDFYKSLPKFVGFGLGRGKLTYMLHWKPTAVGRFWVVP